MISEFKRRVSREIYGNQSYLNFIKKNHQLIQEQFTQDARRQDADLPAQGSGVFPREDSPVREGKVIHDSLSRFKAATQQHTGEVYHLSSSHQLSAQNHLQEQLYSETLRKNDQIAATLISSKILQANKEHKCNSDTRKQSIGKEGRSQAARELLFHLNKNRSVNSKKVEMRKIEFDRYQSIQEPAVELNLKFPVIEQPRNMATIDLDRGKMPFLEELRSRMKLIDKRQRTDREDEVALTKKEQTEGETSQEHSSPTQRRGVSPARMRDELYGLLPSFRSPGQLGEHKKKHKLHKNFKLKIQIAQEASIREVASQFLQKNIITKSIPINSQKTLIKEAPKQPNNNKIIFNKPVLDATGLQGKEELDLIENLKQEQGKELMEQSAATQDPNDPPQEHKPKAKKQPPELKYEGDYSIYDLKIRSYREFLFMLGLAHRVFDPVLLKDASTFKPENRYRFYLGRGNNYLLVKSLLQRRFWWTAEQDPKKANFAWTQLKLNYFYQYQHKTAKPNRHFKADPPLDPSDSPKKRKKGKGEQKQAVKAGAFKAPLPPNDRKILTLQDKKHYDEFLQKAENPEKLLKFSNRLRYFGQEFFRSRSQPSGQRVHNHLQFNFFIGNKKALFYNLKQYYQLLGRNVFEVIPLTFHIKHGTNDPQYQIFRREYSRLAKEKLTKKTLKNVWIVKPGELSNRGQGITVIDELYELNNILKRKEKHFNGTEKTYIVQKYIERPLLYRGRKFDIRHYMMISRLHGSLRAYWFGQGYIRTSSYQFNLNDIGQEIIHLTNDAIQKYCDGYGKYEEGNKVSYNEFQRYMDAQGGREGGKESKFSFSEMIYPKMKAIALDAVKATYLQLDPNNLQHNFQIFGLDFMIDCNYDVWLIQVNTNPCLELSSKLLARLIPTMVQQSLRLTLDVIFPPPTHYPNSQKYLAPDNPLERLQFQLIFDEERDGASIEALFANAKRMDMGEVDEEDETYENDGKEIELDNDID